MSKLLIHIVTGPENPTRATLALLVARTAATNGHDVSVFFAGDGVSHLRPSVMDEERGPGVGSAREHYDALRSAGGTIFASGMSSKARGIDGDLTGAEVQFAPPDRLVELILDADRVVTY